VVDLTDRQFDRYSKAEREAWNEWNRRCERRRFICLIVLVPAAGVMLAFVFSLGNEEPIISKSWDIVVYLVALVVMVSTNFWPIPQKREVYEIDFAQEDPKDPR
jgi:hypothetical protein